MCGITGIFSFNTIGRMHLVHLEESTRKLERRGPDVHRSWFDEKVGLGHRRLSIIDTSEAGNQPMQDPTGRYRIVYNGEIYNFRALREELKALGVSFQSDCDTEVLLHALIHWGKDCLQKLNGFFAFAFYDAQEKSLLLARDRFGIKPLVFYTDEDKLLFASELKSLLAYGIPREINREALHLYFQLTYIPAPHSIFKGVQKLAPGHWLSVDQQGWQIGAYYQLPYTTSPTIRDFDAAKKQVVERLRESVHDRLIADVPLGAFLSGGIDSSVIVALASESVRELKTFSIGFKDNRYFDETHYARLVAEQYKTDHHEFSLTNQDLLAGVEAAVSYLDEPFADSSALPVYLLSQEVRKHVTVALSGDGADEVFSGYNKHAAWWQMNQGGARTKLLGKLGALWRALPQSRNNPMSDFFRKLDRFARAQNLDLKQRYWFLASFTPDVTLAPLIRSEFTADRRELERFKSEVMEHISTGEINQVLATDCRLVLPGDMLTKVDLMSMANSLEVRVPFLDWRLVELAFNLPSDFKVTRNERKRILKEAFRELLPKELYTRAKHGFEVPLLDWFRHELRDELGATVFNRERIEAQGIFHWLAIDHVRERLISHNPGDAHILAWSLYVFQKWYDRYFV